MVAMHEGLKIIGIAVVTTNHGGKSQNDIPSLWQKFFVEKIFDSIPHKSSNDILAIYTDYKNDFTEEYTTIIGCKVETLAEVPNGLIGREFPPENFKKFVAKGQMPQAIFNTWLEIWSNDSSLSRKYTYDFEVYGEKSQQGENSEAEIYLAVK
jgi:predicted transcriptional regulator YdeE